MTRGASCPRLRIRRRTPVRITARRHPRISSSPCSSRRHRRHGQADDVGVRAVDSPDESRRQALDAVGAGLVERLAGGDVRGDLRVGQRIAPHARSARSAPRSPPGRASATPVSTSCARPASSAQHARGVAASAGLPRTRRRRRRPCRRRGPMRPGCRAAAAAAFARARRSTYAAAASPAMRAFVDVHGIDVEFESGRRQQLAASRRGGGQDEAHARMIHSIDQS